ncbi:uncharacterized protein LOC141902879 [Tubulanus polymorphus]|uniref:uncharacterized protein LOC141902879 n=1 Tax=Tubulanus polymorphus TaxID=672921 RepID=UPI003DA34FAE
MSTELLETTQSKLSRVQMKDNGTTKKHSRDDDDGWDTDLEGEEQNTTYDITGKSIYLQVCAEIGVVPVSYFMRHMNDSILEMKHHGLGVLGAKAIAIPLVTNTSVLTLDLSDNAIEGEGAQYISEMLTENCYISELNLSNNNLGSDGAIAVCDMLSMNRTIRKVDISANAFSDKDAAVIANFILDNNRIQEINISYNEFSEKGGELLGPAISENEVIEKLDLSWNHLRLKGGVAVVDGVKNNARLKSVNLSFNGLGNEGACALAELFKNNNVLLELDFSSNRIMPEGALLMAKGLDANETLKALRVANNPIGSAGALALINAIHNDRSLLKLFDLTGIQVCKEFDKIHKEMLESGRDIVILHGGILGNYIIKGSKNRKAGLIADATDEDREMSELFGTPLEIFMKTDPMAILKSYVDRNNLRLVDLFNRFDKDKNYKISLEEFKKGLAMADVGLTENQIEALIARLDKSESDGMVDYRELAKGSQQLIQKIRKLTKMENNLVIK